MMPDPDPNLFLELRHGAFTFSILSSGMSPQAFPCQRDSELRHNVPFDGERCSGYGCTSRRRQPTHPAKGVDTNYSYNITGNALDDQLYLLGHVIPTIESADNIHKFGIHLAPEATWMSIVCQCKDLALFKHKTLGLPNGRKIDPSIPQPILDDTQLMKHCTREILATDGVLGFYNASKGGPHKYARIQFKMTARKVMEQMANFLRQKLCLEVSLRSNTETIESPYVRPRHTLQINRSDDIENWRREIGFSNPSHITRTMVFEQLGECPPRTSILDRLAYLSGCSNTLKTEAPILLIHFGT